MQRECTHDGPGVRTTIFLKGCPLHCPWCQNPEGIRPYPELVWIENRCIGALKCVKACPKVALTLTPNGIAVNREKCNACGECVEVCPAEALEVVGKFYKVKDVVDIVMRDKVFYDKSRGGVTLSGGEPALQHEFSAALLRILKRLGVHTAIETSLGLNWKILRPIIELTDLVILDIKTMDENKHLKYVGVPLSLVLANAENIAAMGKPIWVHTPIIPRYTDGEENIKRIAQFVNKKLPTAERYELLAFNKTCSTKYRRLGLSWDLENEDLIPEERMEKLANVARGQGVSFVYWSGLVKKNGV
ncbi:MAG: glycyl-radical enzyme activating protein [Thermoplasmatales archaeon]